MAPKSVLLVSVLAALIVLALPVAGHARYEHFAGEKPSWREHLQHEVSKLGLVADVTATLEESLFQKICAAVVPAINQYVQGLVIPGQSGSHFSFDNVVIQQFDIANLSITFAAPSSIEVSLSGLSFSIPKTNFDVWERIIVKISCSGQFWASMSGTNIALSMAVSETNGQLTFGDAQSTVQWGSLNIQHDFPNFFCKVGQDIVQLFVGNINSLITNLVEKDIPAKIGPMVQTALNAAMAKLPLDVVSPPIVTASSMSFTIDLLNGAGVASKLRARRPAHPVRGAIAPRDLELEIPSDALDNILLFMQQKGLFNMNVTVAKFNTSVIQALLPAVYAECPDCPFAVELNCVNAPTLALGNESVTLSVLQTIVGLNIAMPNGTIMPFLDVFLNTTLGVDQLTITSNNTVYFQLALQSFELALRYSAVGPIDVSIISDILNVLLTLLVGDFNKKFTGIALPAVLQAGELDVTSAAVLFGANIQI